MANILVTGGAGYIGSRTAQRLLDEGHSVVVVDNLSVGALEAIPEAVKFYKESVSNIFEITSILRTEKIDAVVHCAGHIVVSESVQKPFLYYRSNAMNTMNLLEAMHLAGVKNMVFSSTASVYGDASSAPAREDSRVAPMNPYAESKHMAETIIRAAAARWDMSYVIFRYFNVAGAALDGSNGIRVPSPTHLIPNVVLASLGKINSLKIFGNDYPTVDGFCVRDYVHVLDLADAHERALSMISMSVGRVREIYNLGSQFGYSVREVVRVAQEVLGKNIPFEVVSRRAGDPASVLADSSKAREYLGWVPRYDLPEMIASEYKWRVRD